MASMVGEGVLRAESSQSEERHGSRERWDESRAEDKGERDREEGSGGGFKSLNPPPP